MTSRPIGTSLARLSEKNLQRGKPKGRQPRPPRQKSQAALEIEARLSGEPTPAVDADNERARAILQRLEPFQDANGGISLVDALESGDVSDSELSQVFNPEQVAQARTFINDRNALAPFTDAEGQVDIVAARRGGVPSAVIDRAFNADSVARTDAIIRAEDELAPFMDAEGRINVADAIEAGVSQESIDLLLDPAAVASTRQFLGARERLQPHISEEQVQVRDALLTAAATSPEVYQQTLEDLDALGVDLPPIGAGSPGIPTGNINVSSDNPITPDAISAELRVRDANEELRRAQRRLQRAEADIAARGEASPFAPNIDSLRNDVEVQRQNIANAEANRARVLRLWNIHQAFGARTGSFDVTDPTAGLSPEQRQIRAQQVGQEAAAARIARERTDAFQRGLLDEVLPEDFEGGIETPRSQEQLRQRREVALLDQRQSPGEDFEGGIDTPAVQEAFGRARLAAAQDQQERQRDIDAMARQLRQVNPLSPEGTAILTDIYATAFPDESRQEIAARVEQQQKDIFEQRVAIGRTAGDLGIREETRRIGEATRVLGDDLADVDNAIEGRKRELLSSRPDTPMGLINRDDSLVELRQRRAELDNIRDRIIAGRLTSNQAALLRDGGALPVSPQLLELQRDAQFELNQTIRQERSRGGQEFISLPFTDVAQASPNVRSLERQQQLIDAAVTLVQSGHLTNDEAQAFVSEIPRDINDDDFELAKRELGDISMKGAFIPIAGVPFGVLGTAILWKGDTPTQRGLNVGLDLLGFTALGGATLRGARAAQLTASARRIPFIAGNVFDQETAGLVQLFRNPAQAAKAVIKRARVAPVTAVRSDTIPLIALGRLEQTARIPTEAGIVRSRPTSTLPISEEVVNLLSPNVEKANLIAATRRMARHNEELADRLRASGNLAEAKEAEGAALRMRAKEARIQRAPARSDVLRVRDEVTAALVEGERAQVRVGSVSELGQVGTITADPSIATRVLDRALVHGVPDGRNFMVPNPIPVGKEGRGLFTTPELYSNFIRSTASKRKVPLLRKTRAMIDAGRLPDRRIPSVVLITDDKLIDAALRSRGTGFYQPVSKAGRRIGPRVAELEEVLENVQHGGASQTLYTHDLDGNLVRVLVLGPKLTRRQITQMKLLAPQEQLRNVMRPMMRFSPDQAGIQARMNQAVQEGREVARLVERAESARAAGRVEEAAELFLQADRRAARGYDELTESYRGAVTLLGQSVPAVIYSGDSLSIEGADDSFISQRRRVDSANASTIRADPFRGANLEATPETQRVGRLPETDQARTGRDRRTQARTNAVDISTITRLSDKLAEQGDLSRTERQQASAAINRLQRADLSESQREVAQPSADFIRENVMLPPASAPEPPRPPTDTRVPEGPRPPDTPRIPERPRIPSRTPAEALVRQPLPRPPRVPIPTLTPPPVRRPPTDTDDGSGDSESTGRRSDVEVVGLQRGAVGDTRVDLTTGQTRTVKDIRAVPARPTKKSFTVLERGPVPAKEQVIPWGVFNAVVKPSGQVDFRLKDARVIQVQDGSFSKQIDLKTGQTTSSPQKRPEKVLFTNEEVKEDIDMFLGNDGFELRDTFRDRGFKVRKGA